RRAVGSSVVAERRTLTPDARIERAFDAFAEGAYLVRGERAGRPQRMHACPPERLVDVDVAQPRDGPLVEQRSLDRGLAVGEAAGERLRRERTAERLAAEALCEVGVECVGLHEQPCAEAPDVAVDDLRAVV